MENLVKIEKKYLIFREDAKKIAQRAKRKHADKRARSFALDFSQVEFMSRSFADEFLSNMRAIEDSGAKMSIVNLKPALQDFMQRINKKKLTIQRELAAARGS